MEYESDFMRQQRKRDKIHQNEEVLASLRQRMWRLIDQGATDERESVREVYTMVRRDTYTLWEELYPTPQIELSDDPKLEITQQKIGEFALQLYSIEEIEIKDELVPALLVRDPEAPFLGSGQTDDFTYLKTPVTQEPPLGYINPSRYNRTQKSIN